MSKLVRPAGGPADKPWIVGAEHPTRGNLLWAIASGRIPPNVADRLYWVDGCWTFAGGKDEDGYGLARVGRRMHRVHRLVYEAVFGPIPDGYDLHHEECGRKACCDPRHVAPVPHGTHSRLTRMASGARLSTAAAEGIRERYAAGGVTQASLAALHGVSQSTISAALSGRTWNPA